MTDLFVFDTSAILTFTDAEPGAEQVEKLLESTKTTPCQILAVQVSLMELHYITIRQTGEDAAAKMIALVKAWPMSWVALDEKILLQAGKLKAAYRLSVADAMIAAVAKLQQARLVHKDPEFKSLGSEIQLLSLPFKPK